MMEDRFFETLNRFMLPIDMLNRVIDSSYFLRKNLSFVFAQGYTHPEGGFYGKLINYPHPEGPLNIFGRRYATTNKRMVNGTLELIPIDEQLEIHYRVEPELARGTELPPFAEYHTVFSLDDCLGYFDHRHSLKASIELYPELGPKLKGIADFLETPLDMLGVTGSLAYGKLEPEHEDIDLTVHGSVAEHRRMITKIREWLKIPEHRVFEFGKYWPMRFYFEDTLVCPFFIYEDMEEIPLADIRMETIARRVDFTGRVADDSHGIYLPLFLILEDVTVGEEKVARLPLIIYDSAIRGEFVQGDQLEGNATLVKVIRANDSFRALLVTINTAVHTTGPRI